MNIPIPSIEQIKDGIRATWMAGDFGVVAKTISKGAEEFVERIGIAKGSERVGCGNGDGEPGDSPGSRRLRCDGHRHRSEPAEAGLRSRGG